MAKKTKVEIQCCQSNIQLKSEKKNHWKKKSGIFFFWLAIMMCIHVLFLPTGKWCWMLTRFQDNHFNFLYSGSIWLDRGYVFFFKLKLLWHQMCISLQNLIFDVHSCPFFAHLQVVLNVDTFSRQSLQRSAQWFSFAWLGLLKIKTNFPDLLWIPILKRQKS